MATGGLSSVSEVLNNQNEVVDRRQKRRRSGGRLQSEQARLPGVIDYIKDDGTFGFIKPLETLPESFGNKNVYFNPKGVRYEQGDTVEFVLRDNNKSKPNARNVWLIKRVHAFTNPLVPEQQVHTFGPTAEAHSFKSHPVTRQQIRTLGTIDELGNVEGWIRVVGKLPTEYKDKSEKIYFEKSWVTCGHIDLVPGDIVEFNISESKKRAKELSAYQIKLVECRQRGPEKVHDYIKKIRRTIESEDILTSVLSCDAVWKILSQCKYITLDGIIEILDFIQTLNKKSQGRSTHFRQALKMILSSGFCDVQNGTLKLLIEQGWESLGEEDKEKIQHFLLTVMQHVPERSRLLIKLIRLMIPNGKHGFEHFMYNALKLAIQDGEGDIEDYDWNELPLVPSTSELLSSAGTLANLKTVRVKGAYDAPEEYMDTYFRLLRADCFSALQTGIDNYLENTLDPRDMSVYTEVSLAGIHISTTGNGLVLALKVKPLHNVNNWEMSSSLMSGNLLCLSPSGSFKDVIWATVAEKDKKNKQTIWVELSEELNTYDTSKCLVLINNASGKIVMAESPTYYKAYEPVLKTLQQINPSELPFQEELVYMESAQPSPYAKTTQPSPYAKTEQPTPYAKTAQLSPYAKTAQPSPYAKTEQPSLNAKTTQLSPIVETAQPSSYVKETHSDKTPQTGDLDPVFALARKRLGLFTATAVPTTTCCKVKEELTLSTMNESQAVAFKQALQNKIAILESQPSVYAPTLTVKQESTSFTMDESQAVAFNQALQNRVAIIQGPPGTGKTYIGIKIIEELLKQKSYTERDGPIVVVTYKNHALDEFLKALLQRLRPGQVVRIGGRSQEPDVQSCNLQVLKMKEKHNATLWYELKDQASELKESIECVVKDLLTAKKFSVKALLKCFTAQQIEELLQGCNPTLCKKSKEQWQIAYAWDMLPIWHEYKDLLLDQESGEKWDRVPYILLKFMEAAIEQWAPSKEEFQKLMHGSDMLPGLVPVQLPEKKKNEKKSSNDPDLLQDEKDAEQEERERAAGGGISNREFTMNVNVNTETRNTQNLLEMTASAEQLAGEISLTSVQHIPHLWSLTTYERAVVIQIAMWHNNANVERDLENLLMRYNRIMAARKDMENEQKLGVLQKAKVVGMTITGASINQALLKMLQPSVVLVEEAAEVLEPQITAILGNCNVKHLILIGDHKQLRPQVESYNLCRNFHFDISMMERLINNGYPHATLKLQNRMRPEIAELLSDIYPDLKSNLPRVTKNKAPDFTASSMYFWTHKDAEEAARSYSNKKEAERVLQLAMVCIQMGYEPKQITILAAYQGQVRLLRNMLKRAEDEKLHVFAKYKPEKEEAIKKDSGNRTDPEVLPKERTNTISISTIDMFQGDENDIIIVSLVRSNKKGQIGFLKTLNRRCVAQSRAKCGMFFVGNETTFTEARGSCWGSLIRSLQERNLVGQQFALHCPLHKGITEIRAKIAEELPLKVICKEKCRVEMKCGIHPCPQVCCPKHSHKKCEVIMDFVLPCKHAGKRLCYQSETDIQCKKPCSELMLCKKHPCPKLCAPSHSHAKSLCKVPVEFVFKDCQHQGKKRCKQEETQLKCTAEIKFQIRECQHQATRQCWQKETDIICREKCTRNLYCGHPCEGLCGQPCNVSKCKICAEKRKYEMEQRRKAEQQAREDAREAAKAELKDFIANHPVLHHCRLDLQRDTDDASEYYDVEDRVKKFIQPGHRWFPEVTRIEKITNLKLQKAFIQAKSDMVNPMRLEFKFHGTDKEAVENIIKEGFRIQKSNNERTKMYGNGIYFATDSSKSAQTKYTKGSNMLLLCEVLIGHSLTVQKAEPQMNLATLKTGGYDSVFAPRNTVKTGGVRHDEYVIFNPAQALPRYVIHYNTHSVDNVLQLQLGATATVEKHILLPKREFDPSDPLDMHFRLAESQFLRLTKKCGSGDKVKRVEYFTNPPLAERFAKKKLEFEQKYKTQPNLTKTVLAFHGTEEKNIESIMKENFSMEQCRRSRHGKGVYLSEFPDISKDYARGTNKLILCNLLPGKGYDKGTNQSSLQPGFDSHKVKEDKEGRAWAHVIYNSDQILPLYVISY